MDNPLVRSASRLGAYSDAIFSIVATVMIVPIAHTEIPEDQTLGPAFLELMVPALLVYMLTFLIVCNTWGEHVWIFETICKVDEFIVLLNLFLMMTITFLPYTFTLLGMYSTSAFAITLFCFTIIMVGVIQVLFIVHGFRNPHMLSSHVTEQATSLKAQRNSMLLFVVTPVVVATCAIIASSFSPVLANLLLLMILFGNFLRRNAVRLYRKFIEKCRPSQRFDISIEEEAPVRQKLFNFAVSKERTECFSDGVFAIVATLIILDICESNIPSRKEFHEAGSNLPSALAPESHVFLAYAGTFVSVGMLWYVHHSLLHCIKEMNMVMNMFNNLSLLSIGFTPLGFELVTTYSDPIHRNFSNETMAIQLNCVCIFMAGISQCFVWVLALWNPDKSVYPSARHGTSEHNYLSAKLCVFPLVSFVVFCVSLGSSYHITTEAFNGMQIGCLGLFILLQIVYRVNKKRQRQTTPGIIDDESNSIDRFV